MTPYPNLEQIVSGTLSYAMGAGKAIVSTPYAYASERLAEGRGRLVEAGSTNAMAEGLIELALNRSIAGRARPARVCLQPRHALARDRCCLSPDLRQGRSPRALTPITWMSPLPHPWPLPVPDRPLFPVRRLHLDEMTGPFGIWQHALGAAPDETFGTCTDDVARALTVDLLHQRTIGWGVISASARRSLAFLVAAFNPATGSFRNFRGADGAWLDDEGSQDTQGRALLAIGGAVRDIPDAVLRVEAQALFAGGSCPARVD